VVVPVVYSLLDRFAMRKRAPIDAPTGAAAATAPLPAGAEQR
jgi:hypothetical protein